MSKHRPGLHKNISSIFNGVPVSQDNGADQAGPPPAAEEQTNYGPPSHLTGTTAENQTPEPSPPKAEPTIEHRPEPEIIEKPSFEKPKVEMPKAEKPKAEKPKAEKHKGPKALEQTIARIKEKLFAPKPGVNPARQKMMVILMPVMFIGMIIAFYKVLGSGPKGATPPPTITPSNAVAAASSQIDWQIPPLYPETLRDPMKVGSVTTTTDGEIGQITVKGIVYSEDDPSAIIGSEILHEGDKVSGATIIKINKNSVEFEMNGRKWTEKIQ
jgi:hypothetical protein